LVKGALKLMVVELGDLHAQLLVFRGPILLVILFRRPLGGGLLGSCASPIHAQLLYMLEQCN
jgi:hypothetical protein